MHYTAMISGKLRIELTGASAEATLCALNLDGVALTNVVRIAPLSVSFTISQKDYGKLLSVTNRLGDTVKIQQYTGLVLSAYRLLSRPILLLCIAVIIAASVLIPNHVFFVEIEGNHLVPDNLILEKSESSGITFGSASKEIRSETLKNNLLAEIPDLQWAGINTYGSRAVISVRERVELSETDTARKGGNIVASKDGIIINCTVHRGKALCKVGQAVKVGQVLVEGYNDCSNLTAESGAEAEIFAETQYNITAITPNIQQMRGELTKTSVKYSLIFGKKIINLSHCSGIPDASCVKMYNNYFITLPGGFQLPVGIHREEYFFHEFQTGVSSTDYERSWTQIYTEDYIKTQMLSGKILKADYTSEIQEGVLVLAGRYSCSEMIGRVKDEEIEIQWEK